MTVDRSAVLQKLRSLVESVADYSLEVYEHAITAHPFRGEGREFPPGMQRSDYRVTLALVSYVAANGRVLTNETHRLLVTLYCGSGKKRTRIYTVDPRGNFNVRGVSAALNEHLVRAHHWYSRDLESLRESAVNAQNRVACAQRVREVLGLPTSAFTHSFSKDGDPLNAEYTPEGLEGVAKLRIRYDGQRIELSASIEKPETVARILLTLRQERLKGDAPTS